MPAAIHAPQSGLTAPTEKLNAHQRALAINLDRTSYDSLAEMGAGQKVARWFLLVRGASETFGKSISAYEEEVSGGLYGFSSAISKREFDLPKLPIAAPAPPPHVNQEAM